MGSQDASFLKPLLALSRGGNGIVFSGPSWDLNAGAFLVRISQPYL